MDDFVKAIAYPDLLLAEGFIEGESFLNSNTDEKAESARSDCNMKSLKDMGFASDKVDHWEDIVQPEKPHVLSIINYIIKNFKFTDVQINIDNTVFNCHLIVLKSYSNYFQTITERKVNLPSDKVSRKAFMMIYAWMLADKAVVQRQGIMELFKAALFLKINDLCVQCCVCTTNDTSLREDSAFMLFLETRNFDYPGIRNTMLNRIEKFFLVMVSSKEFMELTAEEIVQILSRNSIAVHFEEEVFMSAVRWLIHNWDEREQHLLEIMATIRFSLMLPKNLMILNRNVDCPEIKKIIQNEKVQKMIVDGLSYNTFILSGEKKDEIMKKLNLIHPENRYWLKKDEFSEFFDKKIDHLLNYNEFSLYLEFIQHKGRSFMNSLSPAEHKPSDKESNDGKIG